MWGSGFLRRRAARSERSAAPRALVTGYFSTVGDLECLRVVEERLRTTGLAYDVAPYSEKIGQAITGAKVLSKVDPEHYSHVIIVCGPCWEAQLTEFRITKKRFGHCTWVGVNLSMIDPISKWNPFDYLIERDSDRSSRPDLAFLAPVAPGPVVARCIARRQGEYGSRQDHASTIDTIQASIERNGLTPIEVDTKWPASRNRSGLASSDQIVSVLKRCDFIMTNRLHGMVFALKAGLPALVIDSVIGGGKVSAQADCIGWPICVESSNATVRWMDDAIQWCMSSEARERAEACSEKARAAIAQFQWPSPLS